jgi:hypothetical protein
MLEFVIGRMTNKKVSRVVIDDDLLLEEKKAILHMDVMCYADRWVAFLNHRM